MTDKDVLNERQRTKRPPFELQRVHLHPGDFSDVDTTHARHDHLGCLPSFSRAVIHIQNDELAFARAPGAEQAPTLEQADVAALEAAALENRARRWDGDGGLVPGISLHRVGGHTPGLQVVRVNTRQGWAELASDSAHFDENRTSSNPFPIFENEDEVVAAYERCEELAANNQLVLAGHDPHTRVRARWRGLEDVLVPAE
ncbi:hypothetical protein [Arthrobacter zhaoguopingii]|uniref:hypothetical protein n=1 Tax=Arthrobacter zhaoguopingii TaxID=2681491 RepID=UPI00135A0C76|nr:hypothetical protein [Arthrobacter zhaoguopingii]